MHLEPESGYVVCKVAVVGSAGSGRSTVLRFLHEHAAASVKSPLEAVAIDKDAGLGFGLVPPSRDDLQGHALNYQLLTLPGTSRFQQSREALLERADAILLVVDSRRERLDAGVEVLNELLDTQRRQNAPLGLPMVVLYNHQDAASALKPGQLAPLLNSRGAPEFAGSASRGAGVLEAWASLTSQIRAAATEVLDQLRSAAASVAPRTMLVGCHACGSMNESATPTVGDLLRCGVCGAAMEVVDVEHGLTRAPVRAAPRQGSTGEYRAGTVAVNRSALQQPQPSAAPAATPGRPYALAGCELIEELDASPMGARALVREIASGGIFRALAVAPELLAVPGMRQQLEPYTRMAGRILHPAILPFRGLRHQNQQSWILSAEAPGHEPLSRLLARRRTLQTQQAVELVRAIAVALDEAARGGVTHGLLHADAILVDGENQILLDDLALPKNHQFLLQRLSGNAPTTEFPLAPEHLSVDAPSDLRTDMFLLGALLFRMVTGSGLVCGYTPLEALHRIAAGETRELRSPMGAVPKELEACFRRMVAIDRRERFQHHGELIEQLDRCRSLLGRGSGTVGARKAGPTRATAAVPGAARTTAQRNPAVTPARGTRKQGGGAGVVIAVVTVIVVVAVGVLAALIIRNNSSVQAGSTAPELTLQTRADQAVMAYETAPADLAAYGKALTLIEQLGPQSQRGRNLRLRLQEAADHYAATRRSGSETTRTNHTTTTAANNTTTTIVASSAATLPGTDTVAVMPAEAAKQLHALMREYRLAEARNLLQAQRPDRSLLQGWMQDIDKVHAELRSKGEQAANTGRADDVRLWVQRGQVSGLEGDAEWAATILRRAGIRLDISQENLLSGKKPTPKATPTSNSETTTAATVADTSKSTVTETPPAPPDVPLLDQPHAHLRTALEYAANLRNDRSDGLTVLLQRLPEDAPTRSALLLLQQLWNGRGPAVEKALQDRSLRFQVTNTLGTWDVVGAYEKGLRVSQATGSSTNLSWPNISIAELTRLFVSTTQAKDLGQNNLAACVGALVLCGELAQAKNIAERQLDGLANAAEIQRMVGIFLTAQLVELLDAGKAAAEQRKADEIQALLNRFETDLLLQRTPGAEAILAELQSLQQKTAAPIVAPKTTGGRPGGGNRPKAAAGGDSVGPAGPAPATAAERVALLTSAGLTPLGASYGGGANAAVIIPIAAEAGAMNGILMPAGQGTRFRVFGRGQLHLSAATAKNPGFDRLRGMHFDLTAADQPSQVSVAVAGRTITITVARDGVQPFSSTLESEVPPTLLAIEAKGTATLPEMPEPIR